MHPAGHALRHHPRRDRTGIEKRTVNVRARRVHVLTEASGGGGHGSVANSGTRTFPDCLPSPRSDVGSESLLDQIHEHGPLFVGDIGSEYLPAHHAQDSSSIGLYRKGKGQFVAVRLTQEANDALGVWWQRKGSVGIGLEQSAQGVCLSDDRVEVTAKEVLH